MRGSTTVTARRLREDLSGAALVEFALVAPVFLALLIALVQLGLLGMASANFNGAMDSVARTIRTGQDDRPQSIAQYRKLICDKMADKKCQSNLRVTVHPVAGQSPFSAAQALVQSQDVTTISDSSAYNTGKAEDVMLVTATYRWSVILPLVGDAFVTDGAMDVLMVSRAAFRNEPWE